MTNLPLAQRAKNLLGSVIDSSTGLLAHQTHDVVRFAMGAPDADLLPISELDEAFAESNIGRYDYGESAGEPVLREEIITLSHSMGVTTSDDRIVVTNGAMQGLDLAFKILIDPGDVVFIESPTYPNGYSTATSYEAQVVSTPVDSNGLVVEALPELASRLGKTPKVIYIIPTFQNPTGVTLSLERRQLLLELAEQWGTIVVEDDPYSLLRFDGNPVPSLLELSPGNPLVFRVQTFSKLIAPGLRIGWIDVDPAIQQLAINAKQAIDTCTNVPNQFAIANLLKKGVLDTHLKRLLPLYAQRKKTMIEELKATFADSIDLTDPEGGFFVWGRFVGELAHIDTQTLFPIALREGVAFVPGRSFSHDTDLSHSLRLCFATSSPERISEGIRRLKNSVEKYGIYEA